MGMETTYQGKTKQQHIEDAVARGYTGTIGALLAGTPWDERTACDEAMKAAERKAGRSFGKTRSYEASSGRLERRQ